MMDRREFGRLVMATAGVAQAHIVDPGGWRFDYPDPLTPNGFCALWDALEARGCKVWFTKNNWCYVESCTGVVRAGLLYGPSLSAEVPPNRAAALLEAASVVLGVKR